MTVLLNITACDSFDWNGITYTEVAFILLSLLMSLVVQISLDLTINNSSSSTEDVTVCDSFDWNGITYTESGVYTFDVLISLVVIRYIKFNY